MWSWSSVQYLLASCSRHKIDSFEVENNVKLDLEDLGFENAVQINVV